MKRYLIVKLLVINGVVIGFVMAVMWLAVDMLAAGYFVTLMEKYHISPEPAHDMFVGSIHRYLIWACAAAVVLAVLLSFVMLRRVLAPLTNMTRTTRRIAAGDFGVRVEAATRDEVGQLADAFNQMAAGLEKLENMRRTLMIDVAHELRTPLTNIRGYLEALDDNLVPPSPQTFQLLQSETMRLAQLVEDVLELARADAAHGHLAPEPMDLAAAVRQALAPFDQRLRGKGIDARVETPHDPLTVSADARQLARVLRNMADNAVRYTPDQGDLSVLLQRGDGEIRVTFRNSVGAVNPQSVPYLFERFYRGEQSRSREHGGAGIGLAIVKEIIQAHGGPVGADLADGHIGIWFALPMA